MIQRNILQCIWIALILTIIIYPPAIFLAAGTARNRQKYPTKGKGGQRVLDVVLMVLMALPPALTGLLLYFAFGKIAALPIRIAAAVIAALPVMYRAAVYAFSRIDWMTVQAARTLGMNEITILIKVLEPQAREGLTFGWILTFFRALGELIVVFTMTNLIPADLFDMFGIFAFLMTNRTFWGTWFLAFILLGIGALLAAGIAKRIKKAQTSKLEKTN